LRTKSSCNFCMKIFNCLYDKQQHIFQVHKDKILFCQYCKKQLFGDKSLNNHLKNYHKEVLLDCSFCDKKFVSKDWLAYHYDEHHEDKNVGILEKPYICASIGCQKRFQNQAHLNLHMKIHDASMARLAKLRSNSKSGIEKYPCDTCGKLISHNLMREHIAEKHTEPRFKCTECDKVFHWRSKLKVHFLDKHLKRELKCPDEKCQKVFYTRNVLNAHVKGVHGKTKEHCSLCDKSFSHKGDLQQHIKGVHEGKKSHCSVCGKDFVRNADKNRHERQVHKMDAVVSKS